MNTHTEPLDDDIIFDDAHEEASTADATAKLKKIKEELALCKKERQEFLDGWQRLKADVANKTKDESIRFERSKERVLEQMFESLLPALDSFDAAMHGPAWKTIDTNWRIGVEYIHTQFLEALKAQGIERFGVTGEQFNVLLHEAAREETGSTPGTILAVERAGYRIGERVLRPARVVVTH